MLTFEAVDEHVKSLAPLPAGTAAGVAAGTTDVCVYYTRIRPLLLLLETLPFLPASWRAELTTFISVADTICPPGG